MAAGVRGLTSGTQSGEHQQEPGNAIRARSLAETEALATRGGAWSSDLDSLCERIGPRFGRSEVRTRLRSYIVGLLSRANRKNCWGIAEYVGEQSPDGMQRLLSTSRWSADDVRDDLRDYVVGRLADNRVALSIGEIGFLRKGRKSAGVKRQWNPCSGRTENCQVGVFLALEGEKGRAFIDRELFLPEEWAFDPVRRREALVPEWVQFASKAQLALQMLQRAWGAGIAASWVIGGESCGGDDTFRDTLEEMGQPFVLRVLPSQPVSADGDLCRPCTAERKAASTFKYRKEGKGKSGTENGDGPDWTLVPIAGPDKPGWCRWLLVRRRATTRANLTYYLVFALEGTTQEEIVEVAGLHDGIRESAREAKLVAGLDGYEVRHWDGWYRHITLSLLAHALLTTGRAKPGVNGRGPSMMTSMLGVQECIGDERETQIL